MKNSSGFAALLDVCLLLLLFLPVDGLEGRLDPWHTPETSEYDSKIPSPDSVFAVRILQDSSVRVGEHDITLQSDECSSSSIAARALKREFQKLITDETTFILFPLPPEAEIENYKSYRILFFAARVAAKELGFEGTSNGVGFLEQTN